MRTYTLKPGRVPEFLDWFEKHGKPVADKHLNLVGFWYTESGELNQVVHIWAFEDLNQRTQQRQKFLSDPSLAADIAKIREMYVHQESKFLMPAAFSPLK
jgi:hypothetical protein